MWIHLLTTRLIDGAASATVNSLPIGFAMFLGEKPAWEEKRKRVFEKAVEVKKKPFRPVEVIDTPVATQFDPAWIDMANILERYDSFLKPEMTGLNLFLEARNLRQAQEALRLLKLQLEDEIFIVLVANA